MRHRRTERDILIDFQTLKDELDTRNVIAFLSPARYAVNCVRTAHHEHVVIVTINGRVIEGSERVFVGVESLPRIMEINRLRKVFNCEGFENG